MKIRFEGHSINDLKLIKTRHRLSSNSDAARYAAAKMADEIRNDNKSVGGGRKKVAAMVQGKKK